MRAIGGSSDLPAPLRHSLYQFGPAQMHTDVSRWLAALNATGLLVCPDPDFSAELLLGMLQGLRLLKAMYWVELHSSPDEIQRHAESISAAFVALHAVGQ
jgi:TetR/AcrR family transcriptional repressor of mexJK operon